MADKNNSLQLGVGFLKTLIVTAIIIAIIWLIGKGALTLIASVK